MDTFCKKMTVVVVVVSSSKSSQRETYLRYLFIEDMLLKIRPERADLVRVAKHAFYTQGVESCYSNTPP